MKVAAIFLSSLAFVHGEDRASSGWEINCKVDTSDEFGPAFLSSNFGQNGDDISLFWSWFGRGNAGISGVTPIGVSGDDNFCSSSQNQTQLLVSADYLSWPNEVVQVPPSIFGEGFIAIPNGFATPGTNDGCIAIANLNGDLPIGPENIQVLTGGCGYGGRRDPKYFYHVAKWHDMDGDGDFDLLTARAEGLTNPTDLSSSDLVWFENPGNGVFYPGNQNWQEYVVAAASNVADTYLDVFDYTNSDGSVNTIVVSGGFASETLKIFQSTNWKGDVSSDEVDTDGYYFYQEFADLDRDGVPDVIATIGSYGVQNGMLVVYEGAIDSTGTYSVSHKSVVYDQFPVWNSAALGSPGETREFYFGLDDRKNGQKPGILVSGDDDGNFYLFTPSIDDNGNFQFGNYDYSQIYTSAPFNPFVTILNAPTVGKPVVMDINGDGCNEIILPNYHNMQIVVLEQNFYSECKLNGSK